MECRLRQPGGDGRADEAAGVGDPDEGAQLGGGHQMFGPGEAAPRAALAAWRRQMGECGQRSLRQAFAGRGRAHAVRTAIEQVGAERSFQLGDALRQRRLRQADRLGGSAHASPCDDLGQRAQVAEVEVERLGHSYAISQKLMATAQL